MKPLVFTHAALGDIDDIWNYSEQNWGSVQADRYTDQIRDACYAVARGLK